MVKIPREKKKERRATRDRLIKKLKKNAESYRFLLGEPLGLVWLHDGKLNWNCKGFEPLETLLDQNALSLLSQLATKVDGDEVPVPSGLPLSEDSWKDLEVVKDLRPLAIALKNFISDENSIILNRPTAPEWWPVHLTWKYSAAPSN
jgi:hypothetical protein